MTNNERYSMNHYKPPSLEEKIFKLEEERRAIEDDLVPIVNRKRDLEAMLTEVNEHKKGGFLPDDQFAQVMKTRSGIVKEKFGIEEQIRGLNKVIREKQREIDLLRVQRKRSEKEIIEVELLELRDKYMSFASDTTRVSSMRAMASKLVEEIQSILKKIQ